MKGDCRPFVVDGHQVGLVSQNVIEQLLKYPEVFHVRAPEHGKQVRAYQGRERYDNIHTLSRAFGVVYAR